MKHLPLSKQAEYAKLKTKLLDHLSQKGEPALKKSSSGSMVGGKWSLILSELIIVASSRKIRAPFLLNLLHAN